jgi:beta-1,4-mannosyl-glycoprotein beta-1,4-N-acetylglucosaminyltransferase
MKVYDVFPFFNESDILKIRINILNKFVDEFIIVEADTTFSGLKKPFFAEKALLGVKEFERKITIHKISGTPKNLNAWESEYFQRNHVAEFLQSRLNAEDILLYGDVDEIPNPIALEKALRDIGETKKKIGHFAQDIFYYYLNNKEVSGTFVSCTGEYKWAWPRKWLGTSISKWGYASNFLLSKMREPSHKKNGWRIKNGGWHFSFMGGEEEMDTHSRVRKKIESYGHQEFNNDFYLSKISEKLSAGKDVFGRKKSQFQILTNYSYLPPYILENLEKYKYLIKEV